MKSSFLYILTFFLSINLSAQDSMYLEYYKKLNIAESHIVDLKFSEAYNCYAAAFEMVPAFFAIDRINALKCACITNDYKISRDIIDTLFPSGILDLDILRKDAVLRKCFKQSKSLDIDEIPVHQPNSEYASLMKRLSDDDQYYRKKIGSYNKYSKEIDSVDAVNIRTFIEAIDKWGFPNELSVGIESLYGLPEWDIVIRHYQQQHSVKSNRFEEMDTISTLLQKALFNYELSPKRYSELIDIQSNRTIFPDYGILVFVNLEDTQFRVIKRDFKTCDSARHSIGLCNIKEYITKSKFIRSKENEYKFDFGYNEDLLNTKKFSKDTKKLLYEHSIPLKTYFIESSK